MADYISTLLDDNETDTISPTTTIPAIRDANNNYLDNTLMAADLNAAKNGKIAALDSGKVNTSDIYNALDQTNAGKVLDARQGKVLNDAINAISDYSTTEKVVGKWTDGSTLYRKTFIVQISDGDSANYSLPIGISYSRIRKVEGYRLGSIGGYALPFYLNSNDYCQLYFEGSYMYILRAQTGENTIYVTIEYI